MRSFFCCAYFFELGGVMSSFNNLIRLSVYDEQEQEIENQKQSDDFTEILPHPMVRQLKLYREAVLINGWHYYEYELAAMRQLFSQ